MESLFIRWRYWYYVHFLLLLPLLPKSSFCWRCYYLLLLRFSSSSSSWPWTKSMLTSSIPTLSSSLLQKRLSLLDELRLILFWLPPLDEPRLELLGLLMPLGLLLMFILIRSPRIVSYDWNFLRRVLSIISCSMLLSTALLSSVIVVPVTGAMNAVTSTSNETSKFRCVPNADQQRTIRSKPLFCAVIFNFVQFV